MTDDDIYLCKYIQEYQIFLRSIDLLLIKVKFRIE